MQTNFSCWVQDANSASLSFFNIPINNFPQIEIRSDILSSNTTTNNINDIKILTLPRPEHSFVGINFINRQHPIEQSRKLVQKGRYEMYTVNTGKDRLVECVGQRYCKN